MRGAPSRGLAVVVALSAACSMRADFDSTAFLCDEVARCPVGQECVEGVCRGDGAVDAAPVDPFLSPWIATSALPEVRDYNHPHAAVVGDFVYLVGGYAYEPAPAEVATVLVARVNQDGTLGPWNPTEPLPAPRALSDAVASDGVLYVVGGADESTSKNSVYYARIAGDGTIAEWTPTTTLREPVKAHSCLLANGFLYLIGGGDDTNQRLASVYFARIEEGGGLGAWQTGTPLPEPRANMGAVVVDGVLYVFGGDDADEVARTTVYHAPVDPDDGQVGTWREAPELPEPRLWGTAASAAGYVYVIGGYVGGESAEVLHARVEGDGATGPWEVNTALPAPRYRHAVASTGSHFYVIGGAGTDVLHAATPGP